jgi:hypothetical protein
LLGDLECAVEAPSLGAKVRHLRHLALGPPFFADDLRDVFLHRFLLLLDSGLSVKFRWRGLALVIRTRA